ncbi:CoA-transferase [Polyangium aurulentum]|uniref:CoA-transferase n=1 Tax=Polyangium aurulentum TaxID=2567896 RepID=UPI0010AE5996|nr:CoA-transferase [Polyangium aurulentum]UQA61215.1 hypothetical protein E8A73_012350 [Polyangium aurulentum]
MSALEPTKALPLDEAVARFVEPGMHLHFASTPSRSNVAIRAICRRYRGQSPGFTLGTTGFHSTAHLLALLGLGARYVACFFGDNYPSPRPNPIYARELARGAEIEHWSLLSYVAALRAGALGHAYGVTNSLSGSTLGEDLARRGRFFEAPDPSNPERRIGLVAAMRPDVTFIHAAAGDAHGRVIAGAPFGEGFWGALAAKRGVVVTVERIVDESVTRNMPSAIALPPHRVLAVCPAPSGAHPQPLHTPPELDLPSYPDDFEAYSVFRDIAAGGRGAELVERVLLASDDVYARHFSLPRDARPAREQRLAKLDAHCSDTERLVILAARRIARLVRARGYRVVLAGIGHAFFAARLAKLWLDREGIPLDLLVETGLLGFDCGPEAGPFLLGSDVMRLSRRLSSVEDALGAIVCGADNHCLAVLGAAQVDARGNINSTRLEDGSMLVGSGGANDIASSAAEIVVLTSCDPRRLVPSAHYVTSPGRRVRHVVTELGALCRDADDESPVWRVEDALELAEGGEPASAQIRRACPWTIADEPATRAAPPSEEERSLLASLKPQ